MRIIVHRDRCQGHARCWAMAPEICELDDEGYKTLVTSRSRPRRRRPPGAAPSLAPERALEIEK
jgi:ferredoxin